EAEKHCRSIVKFQKREPLAADRARRMLAIILMTSGRHGRWLEAKSVLKERRGLSDEKGNDAEAMGDRRLYAILLAQRPMLEDCSAAIRNLEALNQTRKLSAEDRFILAQLYGRIENREKSYEAMDRLVQENRGNSRYLTAYVRALLKNPQKLKEA